MDHLPYIKNNTEVTKWLLLTENVQTFRRNLKFERCNDYEFVLLVIQNKVSFFYY